MKTKVCKKCNVEKIEELFNFSRKNVRRSDCKICQSQYNKKYNKQKTEKISLRKKEYYIESKFEEGMNWNNWSHKGWHIDHIKPLSSFDLSKREEFLKACNYTNLQPLWAVDNFKKSNKEV